VKLTNTTGNVTINVLVKKLTDVPPILLLQRVMRRIVATRQILNIGKNIVFWFIPCKSTRWFPQRGQVEPKHINGGFTTVVNSNNQPMTANIYIYRLEEFPKVMLHEIMHHTVVDSHSQWKLEDIEHLKKICNIHHSTIFIPNEAIVETWAVLLHTMFVSIDLNMNYIACLEKEKYWSNLQMARLLDYQFHHDHYPKAEWKETSNSYCYIVLKNLLLQNAPQLLNTQGNITRIVTLLNELTQNAELVNNQHAISARPLKMIKFRMSVFGDL